MKIYMLWDMEGVSGLFRREQTWHWEERSGEADYEEGRTLLFSSHVLTDVERVLHKQIAHDRGSTWKITGAALENNMTTLRQDGWKKVIR